MDESDQPARQFQKAIARTLIIWFCLSTSSEASAQTFDDVSTDYWAYPFIESLATFGITAGCGGGNYCPNDSVTRAQMAVFIERGMNRGPFAPPRATGTVFLDVGPDDFAAEFIEKLYADGITAGCGNNNYCPNVTVTRAQMAVFLLRGKHGSTFSPPTATGIFDDVDPGHWAAAWIEQLAAEGITAGCGNGNYCPDAAVTRAQMAVFIERSLLFVVQIEKAQVPTSGATINLPNVGSFEFPADFFDSEAEVVISEVDDPEILQEFENGTDILGPSISADSAIRIMVDGTSVVGGDFVADLKLPDELADKVADGFRLNVMIRMIDEETDENEESAESLMPFDLAEILSYENNRIQVSVAPSHWIVGNRRTEVVLVIGVLPPDGWYLEENPQNAIGKIIEGPSPASKASAGTPAFGNPFGPAGGPANQMIIVAPFAEPRSRGSHVGIDFRAVAGTPVYAAKAGFAEIVKDEDCGCNPGGLIPSCKPIAGNPGFSVVIRHFDGSAIAYRHLQRYSVSNIPVDYQRCWKETPVVGPKTYNFNRGDFLGLSGATGKVVQHLHMEYVNSGTPAPGATRRNFLLNLGTLVADPTTVIYAEPPPLVQLQLEDGFGEPIMVKRGAYASLLPVTANGGFPSNDPKATLNVNWTSQDTNVVVPVGAFPIYWEVFDSFFTDAGKSEMAFGSSNGNTVVTATATEPEPEGMQQSVVIPVSGPTPQVAKYWEMVLDLDETSCTGDSTEVGWSPGYYTNLCTYAWLLGTFRLDDPAGNFQNVEVQIGLYQGVNRNVRRDFFGYGTTCSADTIDYPGASMNQGDVFSFNNGWSPATNQWIVNNEFVVNYAEPSKVTMSVTDTQSTNGVVTSASGTFLFESEYVVGSGISATLDEFVVKPANATGSWTAVPRYDAFPKCLYQDAEPKQEIIGCLASGFEQIGFDLPPYRERLQCDWIPPSGNARPGEWPSN